LREEKDEITRKEDQNPFTFKSSMLYQSYSRQTQTLFKSFALTIHMQLTFLIEKDGLLACRQEKATKENIKVD
jgi:hypothetical protein